MSTIRMSSEHWNATRAHLFGSPGEHFAFYLAAWSYSRGRPVFMVKNVIVVDDARVDVSPSGWSLSTETLTDVINAAMRSGLALIEVHNHGGNMPRFSNTDRAGFREFVPYILDSLRGRPYGATVWGDETVYAEYFAPDGSRGVVDSTVIYGQQLEQRVSRRDDNRPLPRRFDRQAAWFTGEGQRQLGRYKVGVVGLGGTGGPVVQNLVYLGFRDFVLVDNDDSDETSMNRLVTACAADLETPKTILARRMVKLVAPDANVEIVPHKIQSAPAIDALRGADLIVGCVDNDGARVVLNELALAYRIPYFDLGVGIEAEKGHVSVAGGRVAAVLPGGPCLYCMNEIDADEARYWLSSGRHREQIRAQGYVRGMEVSAPSVVALNAAVVASAVNEIAIYVSGVRPAQPFLQLDLMGTGRQVKGQWMTPQIVTQKRGCPACDSAGAGDSAQLERHCIEC